MKNQMQRIAVLLFAVVLLAPASSSYAQLGSLKSLAKKAKESVSKKVKDTAGDVAESNAGSFQSGVQGSANGNILSNQELFPYQPVAKFAAQGMYLDGTEKIENYIYYIYSTFCKALTQGETDRHGIFINAGCGPIEGDRFVAYGEPVINAFFYEYFKNPNDYKNFRQMVKAVVVTQAYVFGKVKQKLVDGSDAQAIDKEGKTFNLWESEMKRKSRNNLLMMTAQRVAQQSDYNNVFDGTYSMLTQADKAYKEGKTEAAMNNYREFLTSYSFILSQHPQFSSDPRSGQFAAMRNEAQNKFNQMSNQVFDDLKEPEPMPKTYGAIAGVEAKVRECIAKEDPEHKNAPIVFLSSGWRPLYKSGGNRIDQRAVDVGWTYTDAKGQKWLAYTTLMQKAVYEGLTVKYINSYMFSGGYKTMKLK